MQETRSLVIYLDTSVISAYFDDRTRSRQKDTRSFWRLSNDFQFVISRLVVREIQQTQEASQRNQMLALIESLSFLPVNPAVGLLANDFTSENLVPAKKFDDAQHLALAVVHGVDFLVSWNFKHMVNYRTIQKLPMLAAKNGYFKPLGIITPEAFINELGQEEKDELT